MFFALNVFSSRIIDVDGNNFWKPGVVYRQKKRIESCFISATRVLKMLESSSNRWSTAFEKWLRGKNLLRNFFEKNEKISLIFSRFILKRILKSVFPSQPFNSAKFYKSNNFHEVSSVSENKVYSYKKRSLYYLHFQKCKQSNKKIISFSFFFLAQ